MTAGHMTCVRCGRRWQYPDGFPNPSLAECWPCAWDAHIRTEHPRDVRRIKRAAKRRARRIAERDWIEAMTARERRQVFGDSKEASRG